MLDKTDKAFIEAVYGDPAWPARAIAEKLGTTRGRVYAYANAAGLSKNRQGPDVKYDWRAIWNACRETNNKYQVGKRLGVHPAAVRYAMLAMRGMTPRQREEVWARYESRYL